MQKTTNKRGIKDDLAHGMSAEKAASFAAVPDVIKHGAVVSYDPNWKGRGYESVIIAAPVTIGGQSYMMGVIANRSQDSQRFYVHDVIAEKEATPFNRGRENGEPGGATSMYSILSEIMKVKGYSDKDFAPSPNVNSQPSGRNIIERLGGRRRKNKGNRSPVAFEDLAPPVKVQQDPQTAELERLKAQQRQLEKAKHTFEKIWREDAKNPIQGDGVNYSIVQTSKIPYADQLKEIEIKKMNGSNSLYIGNPSAQLQTVGFSDAPFAMNQSDYRKSRRTSAKNKNYSSHAVPYDFFENMPQHMADAPMVIDNGGKVSVITTYGMKDTNGQDSYVIAGVWGNQQMESDTVNLVKSVYPLDDFAARITKAAEDGKLVITNKNKAEQMLATIGIQPSEVSRIVNLAKGSLSQQQKNVKYSIYDSDGKQLSNGQQEYFKDSKVRDENGKLIPVYHGTAAMFNEFSYDFINTHGSSEGRGFYFTDNEAMAEGYAKERGRVMAGYLDIKKPLSNSELTLSRREVEKLIRKVDPTGDDLLANYDPSGGRGYPSREWYNRALRDTVDIVMNNDTDSELLVEIANGGAGNAAVMQAVHDVLGYDGYIETGKYDGATVYVAFDSSQFKDLDNTVPTASKDTRFSLSPEGQAQQNGGWGITGQGVVYQPPVEQQAQTDLGDIPIRQDIKPPVQLAPEDIAPPVPGESEVQPVQQPVTGQTDLQQAARPPLETPVGDAYREQNPGKKQRKFVETAIESDAVNRQVLPDDLDQEQIHYTPVSNKKTLEQANATLEQQGYDSAVSYFNSRFQDSGAAMHR